MVALVIFVLSSFVFFVTFRALTSPAVSTVPASVRVALAVMVVLIVTSAGLWHECSPWALLASAAAVLVGSTAIQDTDLSHITDTLGRLRFPLYALAVLTVAALVYLFVPITTYLTSPGELSIHLDHLAKVNARDAMVVVYVAAALYAFAISSRMRTVLTLLALGAVGIVLVYTYLLPFGYPMLSGLTFEQVPVSGLALALRAAADLGVIVVVSLVIRALLMRFGPRPMLIGIVLINTSLTATAVVSVLRDRVGEAGDNVAEMSPLRHPLRLSPNHPNVLIIFLDRFMGSYVESTLQSDPALAQRLEGFTWYPRSVSAGENSIAGVHPMLGGYDYLPVEMNARGKSLSDLSVEAFSILPYNFAKQHYQVNMIGPHGLGFTMEGNCQLMRMEHVTCTHYPLDIVKRKAHEMGFPMEALSKSNYADLLVLLASMRTVPYAAKEILLQQGPWQPFLDHTAGTTFGEWAKLKGLDKITDAGADESNFNFVSNILPHEPYYMGEDCVPRQERFVVSDEEVKRRGHASLFSLQHSIAARCALLIVADYLDYLKSAGVYDNTKIVISSDHGIVGPVEDHSSRAVAGGTQDPKYVRARPLVLVKPMGAKGSLQVSEEFTPNADVPRIVCEDIGGCVNPYLGNRPISADGRNDPFYVSIVPWQFNLQKPNAFVITEQLELKGKDPFDARGWSNISTRGGQGSGDRLVAGH